MVWRKVLRALDRKVLNSCVQVLLLAMSCSSVGLIQIITWLRWKWAELGDGVMLSAAATLYRVSVKVLMEDGSAFVIGKEAVEDSAQLTVGFVSMSGTCPNHFVSLLRVAKSTATRQFDELAEKACGPATSDAPVSRKNTPSDIVQVPTNALCRPQLQLYPKTTFGQQQRAFSKSLYYKYSFIEVSLKADAVFCFPCRFLEQEWPLV